MRSRSPWCSSGGVFDYDHAVVRLAELNARAGRLAHALRAHGVGPDVRAGICLERSAELIVALLDSPLAPVSGANIPLFSNA